MEILSKKEILESVSNLKEDRFYEVEIKEHYGKRSVNANSYAWKLIGEIAIAMSDEEHEYSRNEIYFKMLQDYGKCDYVAVEHGTDVSKLFKHYSMVKTSWHNGKQFDYYYVYTGTSDYNTVEMGRFIRGLIQECNNLGIKTMKLKEEKE